MKMADWVQQAPTSNSSIWYPATSVIASTFFDDLELGPDFCGGFESALAMVAEFGVPDDLAEMFSNT